MESLLEQWQRAFDELNTISYYKAQVKTTLYSDGLRYDLEKFDWNYFPSDGPLTENEGAVNGGGLYEYGFNVQGFPCYVAFRHDCNQVFWEGYYVCSDTLVKICGVLP